MLHRCLFVPLVLACNVAVAAEVRFPGRTVSEDPAFPLPAEQEALYVFTDRALTRAQVHAAEDAGLRYLGIAGRGAYTFLRSSPADAAAWLRAQPNVLGTSLAAPVDRVDRDLLGYIGPVESLPYPLWVAVYPKTTRAELEALLGPARLEALRLPTDPNAAIGEESVVTLEDNALLDTLMKSPFVAAIGFDYPKKITNLNSRILSNADDLVAAPYGLDGTGVVVGHWDGGRVDDGHADFEGRVTNWENGDISSHATHTAGTIRLRAGGDDGGVPVLREPDGRAPRREARVLPRARQPLVGRRHQHVRRLQPGRARVRPRLARPPPPPREVRGQQRTAERDRRRALRLRLALTGLDREERPRTRATSTARPAAPACRRRP